MIRAYEPRLRPWLNRPTVAKRNYLTIESGRYENAERLALRSIVLDILERG